jgi:hypothetical protein
MAGQVDSNSDTSTSAYNNELLMATMPNSNATSPVSEASPSKADEVPATACSSDYANNKQSSSLPEMHSNSHSSNDTTEEMETKYDDSLTGAAHADGTTVSFI